MSDYTYYTNVNTGKVFVSLDDEKLINPMGKVVDLNENLFEEADDDHFDELTDAQFSEIERFEEIEKFKAEEEVERLKEAELSRLVSYKNCNISVKNLELLKAGKIVLLVAFGRNYDVVDVEDLNGDREKIRRRCEELLDLGMMIRRTRSTRYNIIFD